MSPWDLLYASNRLIEICQETHVFWKLYLLTNHNRLVQDMQIITPPDCKYMSRKTIAFWAMLCFLTGQCKTQTADCRLGVKCRLRVKWRLQTRGKMQNRFFSWNLWTFLIYLNDETWDFYLLLICFNLRKTPPFFQWIKTRHSKTKFLKHPLSTKQEARCRLSWPW